MLKTLMMPLAAGGTVALGFVVYANVRRWLGARTLEGSAWGALHGARPPERERDPLGPPDSRPSRPTHPVRVTTEAEVAAVIGAEWPLPPAPDALFTTAHAADSDVEAWLTDAEYPDEETAPTQPQARFEPDVLEPAPETSRDTRGSSRNG